ncbi:MAG: hypothetical protein Q7S53_00315 [bacterium]|nr:hypothetical protein [bacterium]
MFNLKRLIIFSIVLFLVLLGVVLGPRIITSWKNASVKKELTPLTKDFVVAWGTYDYNTYPDEYYKKLRGFVTDSYYKQLVQSEDIQSKRSKNLKKNSYSFKQSAGDITKFTPEKSSYTMEVTVKTYTSKAGKTEEKSSIAVVHWVRDGKQFKVSEARIYAK